MGGVGLIDKKMKKNQGKIGDFAALAGLKRASDSVIRAFESLYPSHQNLRFHLRFFAFYGVLSKCRKRLNLPQNGETFGESFRSEFLLFELVSN